MEDCKQHELVSEFHLNNTKSGYSGKNTLILFLNKSNNTWI